MKERILGLDLGTTSVGFALIEYDQANRNGEIIRMGSRIFPEGYEQSQTAVEPKNKQRREKRLLRRQVRRRKVRKIALCKRFYEVGLFPRFESEEWKDLMNTDPYVLRTKGVDEKLELYELGRSLYHLVQRRGFKSSRKTLEESSSEGEKERGVVKEAIEELRKDLKGDSLGKFLNKLSKEGDKKRNRYLARQMVIDEFELLWDTQKSYYPKILNDDLKSEIKGIAFTQRSTFWRLETLGKCNLEPGKSLCLKGSWLGQEFLMLQDLNNLKFNDTEEPLEEEQRTKLIEELNKQGQMRWGKIRKFLGIPGKLKFNLEVGKVTDKLQGNLVEAKLYQVLGDSFLNHPMKQRMLEEVPQRLWDIDYERLGKKKVIIRSDKEAEKSRAEFVQYAISEFKLKKKEAQGISEIALPQGWLAHSSEALNKLLPHMKEGTGYAEAKKAVYPDSAVMKGGDLEKLPSDQRHIEHIRNPGVKRTLNELRKVVNNIIRVYGKPDRIRVELARDLKKPGALRREIKFEMDKQKKKRDEAREDLISRGIPNPDRETVEKWLLWKESEEQCLYTGRDITFNDLFLNNKFQIEHILPRSETFDNRFSNKTLCEAEFNNHKDKRIPFEAFGKNEWGEFVMRVKKSKLPFYKKTKLMAKSLTDVFGEGFTDRQLIDTAYVAREARDFLLPLFEKKEGKALPVETSNGMITSQLRGLWRLNSLLNDENKKTRDDHRHHAIDALVVAMVSPGVAKQMSDFSKRYQKGNEAQFPPPWLTFRGDIEEAIDSIVVSHKVQSKISGGLHHETVYGYTKQTRKKQGIEYGIFYRRLNLNEAKEGIIKKLKEGSDEFIWDDGGRNKEVIIKHLKKYGDFKKYPEFRMKNGEKRKIKYIKEIVPQKQKLMTGIGKDNASYVIKQENHHMVIYETPEGDKKSEVVSLFDASKRLSKKQPVVQRDLSKGRFIMSLTKGDTLRVPDDKETDKNKYILVESIWESGQIVTTDVTDATGERKNKTQKMAHSWINEGGEKVTVDPIGRVYPKND